LPSCTYASPSAVCVAATAGGLNSRCFSTSVTTIWYLPSASMARAGNVLLVLLLVAAGIEIWGGVIASGRRLAAAVAATTVGALAIGHLLGGPDPTTRTAVATTAATRNAGLALLVATLNAAAPTIRAAVLAYIAYSLPIVLSYLAWRRVHARRAPTG